MRILSHNYLFKRHVYCPTPFVTYRALGYFVTAVGVSDPLDSSPPGYDRYLYSGDLLKPLEAIKVGELSVCPSLTSISSVFSLSGSRGLLFIDLLTAASALDTALGLKWDLEHMVYEELLCDGYTNILKSEECKKYHHLVVALREPMERILASPSLLISPCVTESVGYRSFLPRFKGTSFSHSADEIWHKLNDGGDTRSALLSDLTFLTAALAAASLGSRGSLYTFHDR